jgi:tetratricopeptide (TPR) repeat protein
MPRHPERWIAAIAAVAGCGVSAVWSVRAGLADYWAQKETSAATERAIALAPGQAVYCYRLAVLLADRDPARSNDLLSRAAALDPANADFWIELGLRAEVAGDYATAERSLLRAATENKLFLPRWTLANYYYRRNDAARFWYWAKSSAAMLYGDPAPLFALCERVAEGGNLMDLLELRSADSRAGYLSYLLDRRETGRIAPVAQSVLAADRISDSPLLLAACDRLLDGKRVDEALLLWNKLVASHRLPFEPLARDGGQVLTNGTFAISPTSRGFDWRLPSLEGVSAAREQAPAGLRLTFSGEQPESCEPLTQLVPVQENAAYELKFAYGTSGVAAGAGPRWRVADAFGERTIAESEPLYSLDMTQGRLAFVSPAGCRLLRLALAYQRVPGTTRIDGHIVLGDVRLDRLVKP